MALAALKKITNYILGEETDDEEDYVGEQYEEVDNYENEYEEPVEQESKISNLFGGRKSSKVVAMPQPQTIKMNISKPTNFEQGFEIVNQLKQKNAVVINLEYVSKDIARRIIDFVSGAAQALDGNIEKVSNSIFVVAPCNYDILSDGTKDKQESRGNTASWIK
ncbi:MAG: cell division protein SepF [Clostridia bacterium]|nr:cell division protein SepF [Clostridia bacterium]